jgi:hypothetical protein
MGEMPERYRNMIHSLVGMVFYSLLCLLIFHLIMWARPSVFHPDTYFLSGQYQGELISRIHKY